MESLDPKEREKLKKLPDARLTGYLVKAGISLEELETMDRTARAVPKSFYWRGRNFNFAN